MLLIRRIFFYLFLVIYLVACPFLILYSLGYLFKADAQKSVVETGLIYLSTNPPGASVYVNNRRYFQKTPTIIRGFLPGDYPVKLALKDHRSWQNDIPVEAKKATAFEKILLLPQNITCQNIQTGPFEDILPLPGTRFFLLKKGLLLDDLFVYNWKDEKMFKLVAQQSPFSRAVVERSFTMTQSPHILFKVNLNGDKKYLGVQLKDTKAVIADLTILFSEDPWMIKWNPANEDDIFSFQDGYLNRINVPAQAIFPKVLDKIRGFSVLGKSLYVFKEDNIFARVNYKGEKQQVFLDNPQLSRSVFGEKGVLDIKVYPEDLTIFLGEKGELWANRLPYKFVNQGVKGFDYDPASVHALLWTKDNIGILDFSRESGQQNFLEKGPELIWVHKTGRKIEQSFWVYGASHILFRDEDKVFLIELETYGKPHEYELLNVKKNSSVYYVEETGMLYLLDPVQGNLAMSEIVPKNNIFQLPFPMEKENKKKNKIQEP